MSAESCVTAVIEWSQNTASNRRSTRWLHGDISHGKVKLINRGEVEEVRGMRKATTRLPGHEIKVAGSNNRARSTPLLLVEESERGSLPSAGELPVPSCTGQISPGDESEKSLPRHLLPESRSRFHPPLTTRVLFPRESYLCSTGMSVRRVFLHCHRNESRIHGPATCDITGPSGPARHSYFFVTMLYFVMPALNSLVPLLIWREEDKSSLRARVPQEQVLEQEVTNEVKRDRLEFRPINKSPLDTERQYTCITWIRKQLPWRAARVGIQHPSRKAEVS